MKSIKDYINEGTQVNSKLLNSLAKKYGFGIMNCEYSEPANLVIKAQLKVNSNFNIILNYGLDAIPKYEIKNAKKSISFHEMYSLVDVLSKAYSFGGDIMKNHSRIVLEIKK